MRAVAKVLLICVLAISGSSAPSASGRMGFYGIVEKVVFEPDATAPERIQVWGAFAYANDTNGDGQAAGSKSGISAVERGYLYFRLPPTASGVTTQADIDLVKGEWADLAAMAGTGQAVAFGRWGYLGGFADLRPDTRADRIHERVPTGGAFTDLRVRPASEPPATPATYQTNAGIVKLSDQGSHAAVLAQLRDRLRR